MRDAADNSQEQNKTDLLPQGLVRRAVSNNCPNNHIL